MVVRKPRLMIDADMYLSGPPAGQGLGVLPVMASLADHLDVPSKTLCLTAFM